MTGAEAPDEKTLESLMAQGKQVYDRTCVVCHQPSGMGLSDSFPPLVAGASFDADPSIIKPLEELGFYQDGAMTTGKLETQIDVVVNGIPGTRMLAFGPQLPKPVHIRFKDLEPGHQPRSGAPAFSEAWRGSIQPDYLDNAIDRWRRQIR